MKRIKKRLKEIIRILIGDIIIYKDPFNPHYENNLKRKEK